jgi:hypothetical protein
VRLTFSITPVRNYRLILPEYKGMMASIIKSFSHI